MPQRRTRPELPSDVRRRASAQGSHAVLVEAVLDALPSPTLLLDASGTVLLANSAWAVAAEVLDDDRIRVGIGGDYYDMVRRIRDDATSREVVASLQELSLGKRAMVSMDLTVAHPHGSRWYHLQ